MIKWIKDKLGTNRYDVVWDFHLFGDRYSGRHIGLGGRGMTKFVATKVAKDAARTYGEGSHWVESHNG